MDLQVSFRRGYEPATRLRFLSGLAWSSPDALYRRAGLAPGMRCLDVRCGTGQATLPMARMAGPDGQVLGIDPEVRLLEQARHEAARQGLSAEFRVGDLTDLPDEGPSTLCTPATCSLDPRETRRSGAQANDSRRSARRHDRCRGSRLLARGRRFGRDNPAYTRFLELFNALIRGGEPSSPRRQQLPQLLEHAGVAGVQCTEAPSPVTTNGIHEEPGVLDAGFDSPCHRCRTACHPDRSRPADCRTGPVPDRTA